MEDKSKDELWFKAKTYGWGWTPVTWQGWALVLGYVLVMVLIFLDINKNTENLIKNILNFITPFVVGTGLLIFICYKKGEKPHWSWGNRK